MRDDEPWVMSCGAVNHDGQQRHSGALVNWRRRVKGYRKVRRFSDDTPAIIRRSREPMSELNRRIFPLEWRDPYAWSGAMLAWKYRKRLMVIGRGDGSFEGGPIGINHRK